MDLYIAVRCKTPACETDHILMHLGEKGTIPPQVEYWIPHPLMIECPACNQTHDYSTSEKDFVQVEFPQPPPSGYSNKLGRRPGQP
jgi:hypothetical protein